MCILKKNKFREIEQKIFQSFPVNSGLAEEYKLMIMDTDKRDSSENMALYSGVRKKFSSKHKVRCYQCNNYGHFDKDCRYKKRRTINVNHVLVRRRRVLHFIWHCH